MKLNDRIKVLKKLGDHLREKDEYLQAVMHRTSFHNMWFTVENQQKAVGAIAENFLHPEKLEEWTGKYEIPDSSPMKTIGLVMAGNIPLVGFHDLLCVFVAGHKAQIKLSEKDPYLLPYLLKLLNRFDERTTAYFELADKLKGFDGIIATGSNNSARYFEAYFGKYPSIIRRNRNAVAVLTGNETDEEIRALGEDIFQYFGLGCRNVSKIYVPAGYNFDRLLEILHDFKGLSLHRKYKNNFDYNYAVYVLNKAEYKNNGCLVLTENPSIHSRVAEMHYEYFDRLEDVERELETRKDEIQCVVARPGVLKTPTLPFGKAQQPELWDYADGVDTMEFLLDL